MSDLEWIFYYKNPQLIKFNNYNKGGDDSNNSDSKKNSPDQSANL
jgi:hypothetical protein